MKKIAYIAAGAAAIVSLAGVYLLSPLNSVTANPDYICVKNVSRSCELTSSSTCSDWSNGTRVCNGTKVTQVAYFLTRTTCEAGYAQQRGGGYKSGASGRKTWDATYASSNCSITQTDNTPPSGASKVTNN